MDEATEKLLARARAEVKRCNATVMNCVFADPAINNLMIEHSRLIGHLANALERKEGLNNG